MKFITWFLFILFTILFSACRDESITDGISKEDVQDTTVYSDTFPSFRIIYTDSVFIDSLIGSKKIFREVIADVKSVYRDENYRTLWFGKHGFTEQTQKIINLLTGYFNSGVLDSSVLVPEVMSRYNQIVSGDYSADEQFIPESDVLFTAQFFLIASKAWKGMDKNQVIKLEWFIPIKQTSLTKYLKQALNDTVSADKVPVFMQYGRMVEKLKSYQEIMKAGGFTFIPESGDILHTGDTSGTIVFVRKRLLEEGFTGIDTTSPVFDNELAEIVLNSRAGYGLKDTALINQVYMNKLNIPIESRIRQMLINLERWKWIPEDISEKYIVVNIPDYKLHIFEHGMRIKSMKVIVGKQVNQTVIFSGKISDVVFSPYWIIPQSIILKETLPAIRNNKNYLRANNMEIVNRNGEIIDATSIDWTKYHSSFPFTIRQRPGPGNSLGHVKFLFPNIYAIYLHDTPARHLFSQSDRRFSHGCIRIEEPQWLAEYLLADQPEWDSISIEKAMHYGKETAVKTKSNIPVYITYFTSWVDSQGRLHFRDDVYGHDRKLERELFGD